MSPSPVERLASPKPTKLKRLPKGARIQKRPLMHPAIAPSRSNSHTPKVIYVSCSTPFISTVKRVRKYLLDIDKRSMGRVVLPSSTDKRQATEKKTLEQIGRTDGSGKDGRKEEVLVKGTGRAIERVLSVAAWFQKETDCLVKIRTGSVGCIDDFVVDNDDNDEDEGSRIRKTSVLEVGISLK